MLIEDMLDEFGCKLVGPATSVPGALDLIGKEQVEVAVLDLNLDGQDTYAIADALEQEEGAFHLCDRVRVHRSAQGIWKLAGSAEALSGERSLRSRKPWQVRTWPPATTGSARSLSPLA